MFFEKLKKLIDDRSISMNKLAKEAGISQTSVDRYKNGSLPNAEALRKICQYLHVSADYLLDLTDETPPPELTQEEQDLINDFRECDSGTRKSIQLLASSGAAEAKAQETLLNSEIAG